MISITCVGAYTKHDLSCIFAIAPIIIRIIRPFFTQFGYKAVRYQPFLSIHYIRLQMYSDRRTFTQRLSRDISELFSQNFNCSSSSLSVVQTSDDLKLPGCIMLCIKIFEGPYRGGAYTFGLSVPDTYPFKCVEVYSKHPIWHPNIDLRSGRVALPLEWSPVLTLHSVAMAVQMLMLEPSTDNPLNIEAYSHYMANIQQFDANVQKSLQGNCTIGGVYFGSVLHSGSRDANININTSSNSSSNTSPRNLHQQQYATSSSGGSHLISVGSTPRSSPENQTNGVNNNSSTGLGRSGLLLPSVTMAAATATTATSLSSSSPRMAGLSLSCGSALNGNTMKSSLNGCGSMFHSGAIGATYLQQQHQHPQHSSPVKLKRSFEEISLNDNNNDCDDDDDDEGMAMASGNNSNENSQLEMMQCGSYISPQQSQQNNNRQPGGSGRIYSGCSSGGGAVPNVSLFHTVSGGGSGALQRQQMASPAGSQFGGLIMSPNTVKRKCMADSNNKNQSYYSDEMNIRISQAYSQLSLGQGGLGQGGSGVGPGGLSVGGLNVSFGEVNSSSNSSSNRSKKYVLEANKRAKMDG